MPHNWRACSHIAPPARSKPTRNVSSRELKGPHLLRDAEAEGAGRAAALLQLRGRRAPDHPLRRRLLPPLQPLLPLAPACTTAPAWTAERCWTVSGQEVAVEAQSEEVAGAEAVLEVLHRAQAAQAAGRQDADAAAQRLALLHAVRRQQHRVP